MTYTSDVFELPFGPKDFALSINAILGDEWSEAMAKAASDYYGEDFTATVTGTFAAVPEPQSWAMLIAGFGLIGVAARRRRSSTARMLG